MPALVQIKKTRQKILKRLQASELVCFIKQTNIFK
jgi:hypothetical protein